MLPAVACVDANECCQRAFGADGGLWGVAAPSLESLQWEYIVVAVKHSTRVSPPCPCLPTPLCTPATLARSACQH